MKVRLSIPYAPGDIWAATPFIRDFAEQRPHDTLVLDVACPEILQGNPRAVALPGHVRSDLDLTFRFAHDRIDADGCRIYGVADRSSSMRRAFYQFFRYASGIDIAERTLAPEFYPDDFERRFSPAPFDRPVCVLNAGSKRDIPVKHWGAARFSRVVDALRDRVLFVQVGAARRGVDEHPRIPGALDLVGKTTLRDLATLVYHADFVLTGISQLHHIAGIQNYKPRHCITIAGAREPENWANCYERAGVTWHWLDERTCKGGSPGCWHSQCRECPAMGKITPEQVIAIFEEVL